MKKTIAIIMLLVLSVMPCLTACANQQPEPEPTEPVWNSVALKDLLPTPVSGNMDLLSNDQSNLNAWVYDITESDFASYVQACEAAGYTIDSTKTENIAFKAYNKDGYYLSLSYDVTATQLVINLQEPIEMSEYQWPEIASDLPAPASELGHFDRQDENGFLLYVGNTPVAEYEKYVKSCIENGFNLIKTQEETFFEAKNIDGAYVSVRYKGFSIIVIEYNALGYGSQDSSEGEQGTPGSGSNIGGSSSGSGSSGSGGSGSGGSSSMITVTKDQRDFVGMNCAEAEKLLKAMGFTNLTYNQVATDDSSKNGAISSITIGSGSFSKGDTFDPSTAAVLTYYKYDANASGGLLVGYAKADITPKDSVPLGGNGNAEVRYSKSVLDRLYATCIAMTEGDETVLLFSQDLLYGYDELTKVRQKISVATGIPKDHIMISGTHTHSGPSLYTDKKGQPIIDAYIKLYCKAMVKAAEDALADRTPATLYGTDVKTKGMNFIRHYIRQDGTYTGANFGDSTSPIKEHVYDGDRDMRLIKMERQGDKQDILLMNYQVHNTVTSGKNGNALYYLSADIAGGIRTKVEGDTDMLFIYFNGACGDAVANSSIKSEQDYYVDIDTYMDYCNNLGQSAINAMSKMKKIEGKGVKTEQVNYKYGVNLDGLEKLDVAKQIVDKWYSDPTTAKRLLKENDISSIHEAKAIVARDGWKKNPIGTMELNAIYAGGMAFVFAPYEMFAVNGMYIKKNSPFDMTVIATCANYSQRYFATEEAYDYRSYEAVTSYFEKGCAEAAQKQFVKLLKKLD